MSEENLTPAVNLQQEEMPNEMSAAEFQQKLYSWFEDRGLLSELRAHLRKQMIGVLKDTALGRTVSVQQKQVSPKLQAMNLLIAEFLLQEEYHYSLSVFSTEVPLISVLPEFPGLTMNYAVNKKDDGKKWQFTEKDMWDILETLGVQNNTEEGKEICNAYYNGVNKEPLLTCLIRMLHSKNKCCAQVNELDNKRSSDIHIDKSETWLTNIHHILNSNTVNVQNVDEVLKIVGEIVEGEKKRLQQESKEDFLKLQITLQLEMSRREEVQKKKFERIQKSLDMEKAQIESDRNNNQFRIREFEHKMIRQEAILRHRYQTMHLRERRFEEREQQAREREEFLVAHQQSLETGYGNLYREQQTVAKLQEKLQHEMREKQKVAKTDVEFLRDLKEECNSMRNQIVDTQETVLNASTSKSVEEQDYDVQNAEQALIRGVIRQLQIENSSLRTLNAEQQFRLEELSQRAAILIRSVEISQVAASGANSVQRGVVTAPPLIGSARATNATIPNSGAGEQGFRDAMASPSGEVFRPNPRDVRRRMPPRRLTVHSSGTSDGEHSPTTDVLQEARERLRLLEQESEEVDRHYMQYRSRQQQAESFHSRSSNFLGGYQHYQPPQSYSASCQEEATRSLNFDFIPYAMSRGYIRSDVTEPSHDYSASNQTPKNSGKKCSNFAAFTMKQQKKSKLDLAQLVEWHFNQAISCMAHNRVSDVNLEPIQNQEQRDSDVQKDAQKENAEDGNQSVASSGVLEDMLAAGTSGISLSAVETTDEKSDSQPENVTE